MLLVDSRAGVKDTHHGWMRKDDDDGSTGRPCRTIEALSSRLPGGFYGGRDLLRGTCCGRERSNHLVGRVALSTVKAV